MDVTIYHNPNCGTSRNTLAMLRQAGIEPTVVEYLKTPLGRERLIELLSMLEVPVRDVLRQKGTPYADLALDDPKWTDAQLIDFMVAHPILMNRPIVAAGGRAKLCRPSEEVIGFLGLEVETFRKEDGEVVKPGRPPEV